MVQVGMHAKGLPGMLEDHAAIPVWNSENRFLNIFTLAIKSAHSGTRILRKLLNQKWRQGTKQNKRPSMFGLHGYMQFQDKAGDIIHACLAGSASPTATIAALNYTYQESRA